MTGLLARDASAKHGGAGAAVAAGLAANGEPVAFAVGVSVIGAFLLALPVAWVYMFTRQKKGYRQAVVHTLVLMPAVIAGIVVLVKNSLALAFSLAGIVAAVRFRSTLDDSRDALYVFFVTALGLAAGVELDVALVLSIVFNAIVLGLWYTDFARTPPRLEGVRAQRQMERALAVANRTSQFVARLDDEVLQAMAPEQLDALARRVTQRRDESGPDLPPSAARRYDGRLRVVASDAESLRAVLEPALEAHTKRWRFHGASQDEEHEGGAEVLEYDVRLDKDASPRALLAITEHEASPYVLRATWTPREPRGDAPPPPARAAADHDDEDDE
ncbi:MAG TPA: DUF4956 domain-containing protein, partial [Gemmatimonadaceae bacterium]|nr:DUF4956 domain-containing protein [Gemmatimonadaceae bacterium]